MALKKTSIYLDDDLDQALAAKAAEEGVTKAEFIRRNLEVVVARPRRPRLSVGKVQTLPGYVPHPGGLKAEVAELMDERVQRKQDSFRDDSSHT